jgi:hypothetical protein
MIVIERPSIEAISSAPPSTDTISAVAVLCGIGLLLSLMAILFDWFGETGAATF